MSDRDLAYLLNLRPKRYPIVYMHPGRCTGLWLDKESKGCGHVVRLQYMKAKSRRRLMKGLPKVAGCPICGARYPFAFYKLKSDPHYQPSEDEDRDLRLLYADLKRMAKGNDPSYDIPLEERVRIHSLGAPKTAEVGS